MRLNLDVNDRQQRARRVENALRDGLRWTILDENYSAFHKVILDGTEETTHGLFNPSVGIAPFFKAALLIRNNYASWIEYINNIAEYPPVIFEPFAGNNQLVMFLYLCECFKVFRLDPHYPFLNGDQRDSGKFFIHNEREFNSRENIQHVVELWVSMGLPEDVWKTNDAMLETDWKQLRRHPENYDEFYVGNYFWEIAEVFGFERFIMDNDEEDGEDEFLKGSIIRWFEDEGKAMREKVVEEDGIRKTFLFEIEENRRLTFDINEFITEASIMLSFDHTHELLATIHELFPQFPEFVPKICREYCLATIGPIFKSGYNDIFVSMTKEEMSYYQAVIKLVEKEMGFQASNATEAEEGKIYHKGVLNMIRNSPQLFAEWETDPDMAKHFHRLTSKYSRL